MARAPKACRGIEFIMTEKDKNNSKPKRDPFERYEKRMSSPRYQKFTFWLVAFTIFFVFFYLINVPLELLTGLLIDIIGDAALPYHQTISSIILVISVVASLIFVIWLWRMYKRHVIENKPG